MRSPEPFALIRTEDQWRRVSYENTALIGEVVQLAWTEAETADAPGEARPEPAGLAFDEHCRLYHSVPEEGRVERLLWAADHPPAPVDVIESETEQDLGDFTPADGPTRVLSYPSALAVDDNARLYIADPKAREITIFDLWSKRLVRRVRIKGRPLDLAVKGRWVIVLTGDPPGLLRIDARTGPFPLDPPQALAQPRRLAVSPGGEPFILDGERILARGRLPLEVPRASDIEFQSDEILVVARLPLEDFRRFRVSAAAVEELPALKARAYDGRGIVRTPDARIGYWTARGFRHAVAGRVRYAPLGRVTSYRLDSGEFHSVWGRLFLDACIPKGTRVHVHCVATDDPPQEAALARTPPANVTTMEVIRPDLSPPMPALSLVPDAGGVTQTLHRKETGREIPWVAVAPDDSFATYEAPVITEAGRYLWVTLELSGNTVFTPQVRSLRAEKQSHDLLRRIPKVFSREEIAGAFLRRFLATFAGTMGELDGRGNERHALLDPRSTPRELLPWLAAFVGLILDERWPEQACRTLIEEAVWLFRFRGTIPGLRRFLEIYLGRPPILIEQFRVRGLGGAILGGDGGLQASSVLGAGFRVGGAVGVTETQQLEGSVDDAFETHAHRFAVVIPVMLSTEQQDVAQHILDVHRPAHTIVSICTVGAGIRVGRGLHVELSSIIGPTGGFRSLQLDQSLLGKGAVLGRAEAGTKPGASRLGKDTRVG
jgi:phage tail-like protein